MTYESYVFLTNHKKLQISLKLNTKTTKALQITLGNFKFPQGIWHAITSRLTLQSYPHLVIPRTQQTKESTHYNPT